MRATLPAAPVHADCFIAGEWVKGTTNESPVISPYSGKPIGNLTEPDAAQIARAVEAAEVAQRDWAKMPIKERSKILYEFRNILLRDLEEISHLKAAESGKTFEEGKAGLLKGLEVLEFALSLQNLDLNGKLEVSRGVTCEYRREPLGVVLTITPFNFPAMVPLWSIPIALVLGNAVVWKPSDKTPLTSYRIAESFRQAGLPAGLLTVLPGGARTVESLIDHAAIKAVAFVGSTKIARAVYERGTRQGKRVLALGGAKNHIILLPDANPELSGIGISDSFTGCAGQRCMAASVLLAVGKVDEHIDQIKTRAASLKLGDDMGAIISRSQVEFLKGAITRAEESGARVILDGRKSKAPEGLDGGNWIGPTILDEVSPGSEAHTVELFGPVLAIIRCKDLSEALKIQATSSYGNACSVFTSNGALADRVTREAKAGMIGVNVGVPVPREPFSFGGINASKFGHGDITGAHSLDFWSEMKKITVKWEKQTDSNWMS